MATATEIEVEPQLIAVDPSLPNDTVDTTALEGDTPSHATSLAPEVTDYKFENGRRYHAYKEGSYVFPNDEQESDRLDLVHRMHQVAMNGKLFYAPVANPTRILDVGTGTGIWALEIADMFPDAEILGNDLSPIQPRWAPPNVRFEVDDAESEWAHEKPFDFVHCRTMSASIRDWPRLVKQCFENTVASGWAEFIDYDMAVRSPDQTVPTDSVLQTSNTEFLRALRDQGIEPCPGPRLEGLLKAAGFEDVRATKIPLPIGTWPYDQRLKEVGTWNFLQTIENVEAFVTYPFSKHLGYSQAHIEKLCADLRAELQNPKMHSLFYMYDVYGKVPETAATAEA